MLNRRRSAVGAAYAAPTALIVTLFFLIPLGLVAWMSVNHWPLLGHAKPNFPHNYTGMADNTLFRQAIGFTLKYTVVITIVLFCVAFALALMVQNPRPGVGALRTAFFL